MRQYSFWLANISVFQLNKMHDCGGAVGGSRHHCRSPFVFMMAFQSKWRLTCAYVVCIIFDGIDIQFNCMDTQREFICLAGLYHSVDTLALLFQAMKSEYTTILWYCRIRLHTDESIQKWVHTKLKERSEKKTYTQIEANWNTKEWVYASTNAYGCTWAHVCVRM